MDSSSFYVDIPSDASLLSHPTNHGGSFTVNLPETIHLSAYQWEVGLAEIIFQQDWQLVLREDIWIAFCKNDTEGGGYSDCGAFVMSESLLDKISAVDTFTSLWSEVLRPLFLNAIKAAGLEKENFSDATAVQESDSGRVKINIKVYNPTNQPVILEMSQGLLQILGFTRSQLQKDGRYFVSNKDREIITPVSYFAPSLHRAITTLWVYTNIIKPHITGHTYSPLLRVIGVDEKEKSVNSSNMSSSAKWIKSNSFETRVVQFDRIHYFPLLSDEISSISILICNGGGKSPVRFSTPVIVKLHFRRREHI